MLRRFRRGIARRRWDGLQFDMRNDLAAFLEQTIDKAAKELRGFSEPDSAKRPGPDQWSKKEELGHLIDSAANNHVRFVRGATEPEFHGPGYQQNEWVHLHGYSDMAWAEIIEFWERYNRFLTGLVRRIPEDRLGTPCVVGNSETVTLGFLIEDYVMHMRHHLDHIFERDKITEYPGAALGV
jgi:DinB superfamily